MALTETDLQLPAALKREDLAKLLNCSVRHVDRLKRANILPERFIPERWSRDRILSQVTGGDEHAVEVGPRLPRIGDDAAVGVQR